MFFVVAPFQKETDPHNTSTMSSSSSSSSSNKAVVALAEELKLKGIETFRTEFPRKIVLMSTLLSNELLKMENDAVLPPESEVTPIIPPLPAASEAAAAGGGEGGAAGGGRRKKRKMDGTAAHSAAAAHSDSEEESEDEVGHLNGRHGHGHWDYTHDFAVPCNKTIIKVSDASQHQCTRLLLPPSFPSSSTY